MSIRDNTIKDTPEHDDTRVMYTVDEALALLGGAISRGAFYNAVNRGEVPRIRMGRRICIPRVAFENWLACSGNAVQLAAATQPPKPDKRAGRPRKTR